ncbi:MAG: succinylglutamate desuccinylase/aspartoacylase family protein [Granulosicoccus sp.]
MMIQTTNNFQATGLDLDLSDSPNPADLKLLGASDVHMTINPSFPGKQHGHLVLPVIHHNSALRQLRVPVCMIEGLEKGPTVTLIAGIHGDEFEGTLTLQRMARTLSPDSIAGRVIIVPSINLPGLLLGSRISPLDDLDLDRCFPGNPEGSISERLAYEVFERLIKPADLIVDLRSGGRDLVFAPSAAIRFGTDTKHQAISEAAMIAFGAPNSLRLPASSPNSCLQAAVNASGRHYVQTELGGGAGISAETLAIATTGCNNILRHWGLLSDEMELRASRMLEVRDESFYVYSTTAGLLEPQGKLGQEVWQGDVLANIIDLENTGSKPHSINVPRNAVLLATRRGGTVTAGDLIAILADEVQC